MSQCPEPYTHSKNIIKVELNLSIYATESDLKTTGDDTSKFAQKVDLADLKLDVDEFDIDKLKTVPVDLCKLSNVVKIVKKTVYDELATKVNAIDTTGFVLKTLYNIDQSCLARKIDDSDKKKTDNSGLVKKKL